MASYALAGMIGVLAGFSSGQLMFASLANGPLLNFYGFVPVALGGMGSNRGAVVGGLRSACSSRRPTTSSAAFSRRSRCSSSSSSCCWCGPKASPAPRPLGAYEGSITWSLESAKGPASAPASSKRGCRSCCWRWSAASLPLWGDSFFGLVATRACIYWVLVAGLNLVVGFAGQIAIGWVALLTIGAYAASALAAGRVTPEIPTLLALVAAGLFGAVFGVIAGLPALRLRTFYFAMTTLGLSTIVTQIALAWKTVTGGGVGIPGPVMPAPFDTPWGFYYFCLALAMICTWMTCNISASRFGRSLVAIRDAEVAAEAVGIYKPRLLVTVFLFSGALAGIAGGLFASLQSYITPDAFTFDLSVLFFIAILIGGRGSILGPLIGTVVLTILPEFAAPLVQWSTFLYAVLLLVIVLLVPGGIADLLDFKNRKPLDQHREIRPRPELLRQVLGAPRKSELGLKDIVLSFGGVRAVDGVDLEIRTGEVHGLIGPNGSGKTTTLNVISGYYAPQEGHGQPGRRRLRQRGRRTRAPRITSPAHSRRRA